MTSKAEKLRRKVQARKQKPAAGRKAVTTATAEPREKPSNPTRRMDGLTWLATREPVRISREQLRAGRRYGEICSEAARAELPGKAGGEGSSAFVSKTLTDDTLDAIREKKAADAMLTQPFPPSVGETLVELMEAVCHRGETLRDIAKGDRYVTVVLEERLKIGLSMLRHLANAPARSGFLEAAE